MDTLETDPPESSKAGRNTYHYIQNLHNHTWRCHHAKGTEKEYIERAMEGGIREFGFSDHTPYWFPGDFYSDFRMFPELLENYVDTVLQLREEYRDDVKIYLALEVEYYPAYFDTLLTHLEGYPFDYLILGQHYLGNEIGDVYAFGKSVGEKELIRYADQTIEAMKTGKFLYLAHPDVIRYGRRDDLYRREMSRICEEALALDMPLEINLNGLKKKREYPAEDFWKIAGEKKCRVILASDAHDPDTVCPQETIREAVKLAERCHIALEERIDIER